MKENVLNFLRELAELMKKHGIDRIDSRDHGYGCSIYIHGGWENGVWLDTNCEITSEYLEKKVNQHNEPKTT